MALAATALTVVGAALPGTASAAHPLHPLHPSTAYTLTVGSMGPNNFASDSPSSPFIDKDGTFYTQQSEANYAPTDPRNWAFDTGTTFDDAQPDAALNAANSDTTARCNNSPTGLEATNEPSRSYYSQRNFCDLIGTWVDPDTGNWTGLVHNEFTPQPFGDGMHYDSIDYATSTDQGHTWTIVGHALTSPYSTTRGDTTAFPNQTYYYGDGDQRLFVDTASGYFYVYYGSSVIDKPGCQGAIQRLEHVARAPISGKMATGTWQKWYRGSWSQAGVGGQESTIVPVDASNKTGYVPAAHEYKPSTPGCVSDQLAAGTMPEQTPLLYMNVAYDAYLGLYIAGPNPLNPNGSAHAEKFFATDSLASNKWHEIADTGSTVYEDYWYHWFVDSGNRTSGTILGKTFRSYCDYGCPSGDAEYRNLTLDSTKPAAPPVDISKTYRISNISSGRTLTQVSGTSQTTSLAAPTRSAQEAWAFVPNGDGSYLITNSGTGQALGVDSTTTSTRAWGTRPTVTTANPVDVGQQWFFLKNTDSSGNPIGSYRLVNRYSGLVLSLSSDTTRLAETTAPRNWSGTNVSSPGGQRTGLEQSLRFTPVGTAPTPPQNVALGKPATAQSTQGTHSASLAVDSIPDNSSYWSADPAPEWWQVDLQADYNLSSIVVTNYVDGTRSYQYNVQASTDGVTWTTIATKGSTSVATSAGDVLSVSTTARYLRVNMTHDSANTGVHIANFAAMGTPAP
ncbi:discoidin domain-containing protein [Peterkaempfera sp. SMS 1(5)a]|uniref:discoidin domain-containing protein n=1 Tax=Peterkaempfera podocarpi TaxID=3232308 RepID=UPI00366ABE17